MSRAKKYHDFLYDKEKGKNQTKFNMFCILKLIFWNQEVLKYLQKKKTLCDFSNLISFHNWENLTRDMDQ